MAGDHSTNDHASKGSDEAVAAAQEALYRAYVIARNEIGQIDARQIREAGYQDIAAQLDALFLSCSEAAQAGLWAMLARQRSTLQASDVLVDAVVLAQRYWIDQLAEAALAGRDNAAQLVDANLGLLPFALPSRFT